MHAADPVKRARGATPSNPELKTWYPPVQTNPAVQIPGANAAQVVFVEARILRRVIHKHRGVRTLGGGTARPSYTVDRSSLTELCNARELGCEIRELSSSVVLVQRPEHDGEEAVIAVWRAVFRAQVHGAIADARQEGRLTEAVLRARVHHIGQTEYDEIRLALRQEELLLPRADAFETYAEFVAVWLELRTFQPDALPRVFPGIADSARAIDVLVEQDVSLEVLLATSRPKGAPAAPPRISLTGHERAYGGDIADEPASIAAPSTPSSMDAPSVLSHRGNHARAALVHLFRARFRGESTDSGSHAARAAKRELRLLALELERALRPFNEADAEFVSADAWIEPLLALAMRNVARKIPRPAIEARLLYDLQRAAYEHRHPRKILDLVTFAASFGRRPLVRTLAQQREVRVFRSVKNARDKLGKVQGIPDETRELLDQLLSAAFHRSERTLRDTLRPRLMGVLVEVGLTPANTIEEVAREKLIEELSDLVVQRGHLGLGALRDAISRNQLKLPDLRARHFFLADPLLAADKKLSIALDGVYRRGEIYLRFLQKMSSVFFGTPPGRVLSLWVLLPAVASFVLLEGVQHLAGPLVEKLTHHHPHLLNPVSFGVLALVILGVVHFPTFRSVVGRFFSAIGTCFAWIFYRGPKWLLTLPLVLVIASSKPFVWCVRHLLKPILLAGPLFLVLRLLHVSVRTSLIGAASLHFIASIAASLHVVVVAEEVLLDWTLRKVHVVTQHILPGLVKLIVDVFARLVEGTERVLYTVDEALRFRDGDPMAGRIFKGILGFFWFYLSFLVRLYVNLLVEPQVNPIKHFPVVTVSHKIMLPMLPTLVHALRQPLMPLGSAFANGFAGLTVFLLPGVAGFLAWELKENYRLYGASRPANLQPVLIGSHGETMGGLLKPGFHSGTLPKLFGKLRRAARRNDPRVFTFEHDVEHVAEAVGRFFERGLVGILSRCARFKPGKLEVLRVELGSNRVRVRLVPKDPHSKAPAACVISFEEQSGWLVASVRELGFVRDLDPSSRDAFEDALAGCYAQAGVDIVREHIERALGHDRYDIAAEGLVIWPDADSFATEIVVPLVQNKAVLQAHKEGFSLKGSDVFYASHPVVRVKWLQAWSSSGGAHRVYDGGSLFAA